MTGYKVKFKIQVFLYISNEQIKTEILKNTIYNSTKIHEILTLR